MSSAIAAVINMMESLPEEAQAQVAEHLQEYIANLRDELRWDNSFKKTQHQLVAAARCARREIAQGLTLPLDYEQL